MAMNACIPPTPRLYQPQKRATDLRVRHINFPIIKQATGEADSEAIVVSEAADISDRLLTDLVTFVKQYHANFHK